MRITIWRSLGMAMVLFTFSEAVFAQSGLYLGYGVGNVKTAVYNDIVDRYNSTRNFLTEPMKAPGAFRGWHVGFTVDGSSDLGLIFQYQNRFNKSYAEGILNNITVRRDVRLRYNSWAFGIGWALLPPDDIQIRPALLMDYGAISFKTKTDTEDKYRKIMKDGLFSTIGSVQIFLPFSDHLGINLEPYLKVPIGSVNYYDVEQELDAANAGKFDAASFQESPLSFGVNLDLLFAF